MLRSVYSPKPLATKTENPDLAAGMERYDESDEDAPGRFGYGYQLQHHRVITGTGKGFSQGKSVEAAGAGIPSMPGYIRTLYLRTMRKRRETQGGKTDCRVRMQR